MKLLLPFLLLMVVAGLVTDRFDRRTYSVVAGAAVVMMVLFYGMQRWWTGT